MFGQSITIPKGKQVHFTGIQELQDKHFILEDDVSIKLSSSYSPPVDANTNAAWVTAVGALKSVSKGNINIPVGFKQLGFQQWTGTEPLAVNFQVGIYMETDAYNDVVLPSQALLALTVPKLIDNNGGLSAPGPALYDVLFNQNKTAGILNITLGPCQINYCVIRGADITFSQEVDSNFYPIWAKIRVDAITLFTANTQTVADLFKNNKSQVEALTNNT